MSGAIQIKNILLVFNNSLEGLMKTYTTHTTGILDLWTRFLGVMLTVALMMPAVAISQPYANPATVNLGTAGDYVILAKAQITATGTTHITGDIGISPAAATFIQGFSLILPAGSAFSTSSLVTGKIYAPGYADPTPANLTTAVLNMETAYTDAAGRPNNATELYTGDLTGQTFTRGVYKWGSVVTIGAGGVTISGSATDVWIFQIAQDLTLASGAIVHLSGGALASNIFWQVAGQVTLGTTAQMEGIILCQTQIVITNGATLDGRALAQTAVTLDANTVTQPAAAPVIIPPTVTSTDPVNVATGVALNKQITATFSTAMNASTISASTFTLMQGTTSVSGVVSYTGTIATFAPASDFLPSTIYTATITTGAQNLAGTALANNYVWSFTTGTTATAVENGLAPQAFALFQNYPNPFNPSTRIQYSLEKAGMVSLKVYNLLGLEVATLVNGRQEAGSYTVPFGINTGTLGLSSGVYFYRLEAGSFVSTKKLILMK
jgi:hypothetical protein